MFTTCDKEPTPEKVMESHQTWFGEGPELAILRILGLFDRPADEQTFGVLLKSPADQL